MRINFLLLELEGTLGSFVVMKTDPFVKGGMGLGIILFVSWL